MANWAMLSGETPIDDISGLKLKRIRTRRQLAVAEAENVRKVVVKYLAAKPRCRLARFDLSWSLKLHKEMFGDVWTWAGRPRQVDLNLGVPWHQVESDLKNLFDDLAFWEKNWPDLIEQAAHLHHRSAKIHPFLNGNGRWARILANIWLKIHDAPLTVWPEETIGTVSAVRDEYLDAIRLADRGKFGPFVRLHQRFSERL